MQNGSSIQLSRTWDIGDRISGGGFGDVYEASCGDEIAVAKFVPKAPGAGRELLFDLPNAKNVIPILDRGEHEAYWVLIMPRAQQSLRDFLKASGGCLAVDGAISVLKDICDALVDIEGQVVHRDIKPENVLQLDGRWCLADFGISRYVEATTALDTRKFAFSPSYAAPERWRDERATPAVDIYSVGIMAFEMISGARPFRGPTPEEFRDQHLHAEPAHIDHGGPRLAALVDECLFKAPSARPTAANVKARLLGIGQATISRGLAQLQQANRAEILLQGDFARRESVARTESERRNELARSAQNSFARIASELGTAISEAAPAATRSLPDFRKGWTLELGKAKLRMSSVTPHQAGEWGGWDPPAFEVVCSASLSLELPASRTGYEGRSHSLWYSDAKVSGQFGWYETAFMVTPLMPRGSRQAPFALDPGIEAAKAVWNGMAEFQVAWPFTPLVAGDLEEFIDRWASWLGLAAQGQLQHPRYMPEHPPQGSWRIT